MLFSLTPDVFRVDVGIFNITPPDARNINNKARKVNVQQVIKHPLFGTFTSTGPESLGDIALVRLSKDEVEWNEMIQPACLFEDKSSDRTNSIDDPAALSGHSAIVAGWGFTDESGMEFTSIFTNITNLSLTKNNLIFLLLEDTLRKVEVPILTNEAII